MKTRLVKIFLFVVSMSIFLFLFTKEVNAGCDFYSSYLWDPCPEEPGECIVEYCDRGPGEEPGNAMCGRCVGEWRAWYCCDNCGQCGGGCFVEGTSVASEQLSDQAIEKLKPGDVVSSFNPETGEVSESQVSEVHKIEREGYYELETESGKKVKVTGEHPFLAIKANNFQLIDKLKNFLSHTLTFRLIISLRTKLGEVW